MKQNKTKYFKLLLIAGLIFALQSCLKNNKYYEDFSKGAPAVEIPLAANNANGLITLAYNATVTSVQIPIIINLASPSTLGTPVTAVFALDTAYLNSYNTANGTNYLLMPDSVYTIHNGWNRTIPAGKRIDSMSVTFDFTKMDLSQTYIFPITIKSSSVLLSSWNHLLLNPSVKNKYDGIYTSSGVFTHPAYGVLTWDASAGLTQSLVTTGPNSVATSPINTSGPAFGVTLKITVNPDNTLNEVFNGVTTPTPNTDHYDPSTSTFYVSGSYVGGSGPRTYKATYTYSKPR